MTSSSIKVQFSLDETDIAWFRRVFRTVRKHAGPDDQEAIVRKVRELVERVRGARHLPQFVAEAIGVLETLIQMLEDEAYALPRSESASVLAALAYFADPADLIPDDLPMLGFLDDAIMIRLVQEDFRHELRAYQKFRRFREGAEQRPWTEIAAERLPRRLAEYRRQLRAEIAERQSAEKTRRRFLW